MTKEFCDFCGEEMHARDKSATLEIHDGSGQQAQSSDGYYIVSFGPSSRGTTMEMCADCLAHLLPVTRRIKEERAAASAKKAARDGVIATELRPSVSRIHKGAA